ncbi:MAG: 3-phosphoshikimate 1-carboxyvinyltransferase [Oscillospiraceae bacterium]|nr:3-phosphoshikimate 1-carboxyvinyltransferase [Oscillospiraceae bacterium]MDY5736039.1 3-phosphoshikimate 1-carboxyvinyltransferase [Oscillospiraceae bacterium]
MNKTILPGARTGEVHIPASKSQAHRMLLCAAMGENEVTLRCRGLSKDILATVACLKALGASVDAEGEVLHLRPVSAPPPGLCLLPCGESGSTLRFLLPLVGALGASAVFEREGRLPERPIEPLGRELCRNGMDIRSDGARLSCSGQLRPGAFSLPGNISSQYISALLMTLPLLEGESTLHMEGALESAAYVAMTEEVLRLGGVRTERTGDGYRIPGGQRCRFAPELSVEGDYSNAAFFLCAGALSERGIRVTGLDPQSRQGDRAIVPLLEEMGAQVASDGSSVTVKRDALHGITIDASPIPDLIPVLSVVAAAASGETRVIHAQRLRLKESDRLHSTTQMLRALGAEAEELPDGLVIRGGRTLAGGTVDACGDHRIVMSAAVAGGICRGAVTICGSECVQKSYPDFWTDFQQLKGD